MSQDCTSNGQTKQEMDNRSPDSTSGQEGADGQRFNTPLKFRVQIELGDGKEEPSEDMVKKLNALLECLKAELRFEKSQA